MMHTHHNPNRALVQISGEEISRIEYRGEPVVSFAQVDKVHERPDGTARRTFNDNRTRFVEGEDYTSEKLDVLRTAFPGAFPARGGGDVILLTKRGYLKLVKPMTDDRAWAVQGEMIDRYFVVEEIAKAITANPAHNAREARLSYNHYMKLARMMKIEGNQAIISANNAVKATVGIDMMAAMGVTHLIAPTDNAIMNATGMGRELGMSARDVNLALSRLGYQTAFRDAKQHLVYEPTAKGKSAGGYMADTGKKHSNGTPVRQLMWTSQTLAALRAELQMENA